MIELLRGVKEQCTKLRDRLLHYLGSLMLGQPIYNKENLGNVIDITTNM